MRNVRRPSVGITPCAVIWAAVLAVGVVGCKANQGRQPAGDEAIAKVLPSTVEHAEALAEDVQSDLDRNAYSAAEAKLRELRGLGETFASVGVAIDKRSAYGVALDSLGAAITRRSQANALTAGNRVSRVVTGIMADFPTRVPMEVAYMDVAGRDVLYAARQGRWRDAANPVGELERSYSAVQTHVKARNPALDQRVTSEVAQLGRAVVSREGDRATSLAQALLDDVDRIEQTF